MAVRRIVLCGVALAMLSGCATTFNLASGDRCDLTPGCRPPAIRNLAGPDTPMFIRDNLPQIPGTWQQQTQ